MYTSKKLALAAALTLMGINGAQASLVNALTATGHEAILSVVNKITNASVMQDLGEFRGDVLPGDTYALDALVSQFISDAGGLSNITFAVTAGGATGGTAAGTYLHSSANALLDSGTSSDGPQNSTRGNVLTNRQTLITGLNNSNPLETNTAVNGAYGPFTGGAPNYLANNAYRWGYSSGANSTTYSTLGDATSDLFLYTIAFLGSNSGNSNVISLGSKATLNGSQLVISSVVPVPAAVWLMGSALGLLGVIRRRVAA